MSPPPRNEVNASQLFKLALGAFVSADCGWVKQTAAKEQDAERRGTISWHDIFGRFPCTWFSSSETHLKLDWQSSIHPCHINITAAFAFTFFSSLHDRHFSPTIVAVTIARLQSGESNGSHGQIHSTSGWADGPSGPLLAPGLGPDLGLGGCLGLTPDYGLKCEDYGSVLGSGSARDCGFSVGPGLRLRRGSGFRV
jgi:hypothetical protein